LWTIADFSARQADFHHSDFWGNAKTKCRRPLDSLLLDEGTVESLLADGREFLKVKDW